MSHVTYQITVWSIYRSTTYTYFDNHKLGVRPTHGSTTNTHVDSHKLWVQPLHQCDLYTSMCSMIALTESCGSKQWHWQLIPIPPCVMVENDHDFCRLGKCRHEHSCTNCIFIALDITCNLKAFLLGWNVHSLHWAFSILSITSQFANGKPFSHSTLGFLIIGDILQSHCENLFCICCWPTTMCPKPYSA